MSKENKYEDIDIVDVEDYENVYELIEDSLSQLNKETDYIAVYGKRDLIAYLFTEMLKEDYQFGYADFDVLDETLSDRIYLMIIRQNCTISVEPAISKSEKVICHDAKIALIDMDECKQNVIDYCVNSDKKVILFGEADAKETSVLSDSWESHYSINGKEVDKETYETSKKEIIDKLEKSFKSFNDWTLTGIALLNGLANIQNASNELRKLDSLLRL